MGCSGSSPPVRGTRQHFVQVLVHVRFIPACAGNTSAQPTKSAACAVHPRLCGEHQEEELERKRINGSSPPVRGTHARPSLIDAKNRFIPACAGNTRCSQVFLDESTVHPRLCGEHRRNHVGARFVDRFIPACAGNTNSTISGARSVPVHPRLCGEHMPVPP